MNPPNKPLSEGTLDWMLHWAENNSGHVSVGVFKLITELLEARLAVIQLTDENTRLRTIAYEPAE